MAPGKPRSREFLPGEAACPVFVNADLIAAGIAPFAPDTASLQAGRLMLRELTRHFALRTSFAFETTLSGRQYLGLIDEWQKAGYRVKHPLNRLATATCAFQRSPSIGQRSVHMMWPKQPAHLLSLVVMASSNI
jgi:predicted ABC-type ATPase